MSVTNFLGGVIRFVWSIIDAARRVLHLVLLLIIFGILAALFLPEVPVLPRSAALVLAPRGDVVEQLSRPPN